MSKISTQKKIARGIRSSGDWMPFVLVGLILIIIVFSLFRFYHFISSGNLFLKNKPYVYLYIPTGSDYNSVRAKLYATGYLKNKRSFEWTAQRMHYGKTIKPGKYKLTDGMSNRQLIGMLRSGRQEPIHVVISVARTKEDLAGKLGRQLEPDSGKFIRLMNDDTFLRRFGLTSTTALALFIPNTYDIFWSTTAAGFFLRMYKENKNFWHGARKAKADSLGLSEAEVITLASIIEKETNNNPEKPMIAGVYINRLKRGVPLQADPTIIYAWGDFSIRRVLNKHLEIKSPYNTYQKTGLPPGPICIPSVASIDAVLNYTHHGYLYFCAKEDLSGTHNFSSTLAEHNRNAKRYQKALNKLNVRE